MPAETDRQAWRVEMRQMQSKAMLCALFMMELILTGLPTLAHACAVCSDSDGYFWGVLFLMAMPFALGGLIGGWVLYSYRRGQAGLVTATTTPTADREMPR
jgi:Ni/Fe-hydrogenase subunit HybB-like protein